MSVSRTAYNSSTAVPLELYRHAVQLGIIPYLYKGDASGFRLRLPQGHLCKAGDPSNG